MLHAITAWARGLFFLLITTLNASQGWAAGDRSARIFQRITLIERLANRVFLTALASYPLDTGLYRGDCGAYASLFQPLGASTLFMLSDQAYAKRPSVEDARRGPQSVWPLKCRPVQVISNSALEKNEITLRLPELIPIDEFLHKLDSAISSDAGLAEISITAERADFLYGFHRIIAPETTETRTLNIGGYPLLDGAGSSHYLRRQLSRVVDFRLLKKIERSSPMVDVTLSFLTSEIK